MTSGIEDCRWKTSVSALRQLLAIHPGERDSRSYLRPQKPIDDTPL